ncbi:MAG: patatin-like phospholipase family protein [Verrucomicrobiota bacterium]
MKETRNISQETRGWWYRLVSWPGTPIQSPARLPLLSDSDSNTPPHSLPTPRLGLALSSGGAKALADIGVIQILEENNIPIHAVSGSSMGAYIGALWAAGHNGEQLEALAAELSSKKDLLRLAQPAFPPKKGLLHGEKIKSHLARSLGEIHFEELDKELFIVATNLHSHHRAVFQSGRVLDAVHASIAIPGVFVPVEIDGESFVDGGASDPLPVSVLRNNPQLDAIIAVSTLPVPHRSKRHRPHHPHKIPKPKNHFRRLTHRLNKELNFFAKGNMVDILRSSAMASQLRLAHHAAKDADVVLTPHDIDGAWHDYLNHRKYIELGRKTAQEKLSKIKSLMAAHAA